MEFIINHSLPFYYLVYLANPVNEHVFGRVDLRELSVGDLIDAQIIHKFPSSSGAYTHPVRNALKVLDIKIEHQVIDTNLEVRPVRTSILDNNGSPT